MTLTDGDEYAAEVVGFDGDRDVAVLQLKMPDTVNKLVRDSTYGCLYDMNFTTCNIEEATKSYCLLLTFRRKSSIL